jgi:hypothetical protein
MSDGTTEYIHPLINEEVNSISGCYVITGEGRISYNGRDVLYITGFAETHSACCGRTGMTFSFVPGFVQLWRFKKSLDGRDVSAISRVTDDEEKKVISGLILKREFCSQVNFL